MNPSITKKDTLADNSRGSSRPLKRRQIRLKKHIIMVGIVLFTALLPPLAQKADAQVSVSFQVFYDQLSPFGTWVSYPDYGYVWVPAAGAGFRPYGTRGHWVYTEDGWTWVSDYSWGWATFHYGNWFYDDAYGWMWVPGYDWAPAWVTWGEYGGNYCWAPIGPRVDIGVAFSTYRPPARYWVSCPRAHITSVNVSNYYVRNTTVVNNITVINNVNRGNGHAYVRGPQPANVERFTHSTIRPVPVHPAERPGAASLHNGQLAIYRPTVQHNNAARPTRVRDLHSMRPMHQQQASQHQAQPRQAPQARHATPQQPHPAQQQHPQQQHPQQPRPVPQQHPVQPRSTPQQHPRQPHPAQPGHMPQQHPQQRPVQHPVQHHQQPRPMPHPAPPPHQNPPPHPTPPPHDPHEHHR